MCSYLRALATLAVFLPTGVLARGFIPYCGVVCRYQESNFIAGLIGGVVLTGAVLFALFHGTIILMILKGDGKKDDSLGESALKVAGSLVVGAVSIFMTGGGALVGLFFIVLYFGCSMLFGKRRR